LHAYSVRVRKWPIVREHSVSGRQRPQQADRIRHFPPGAAIDFKTAQRAELDHLDDEAVLHRAASENRVLVSHDKRTMPLHLKSFLDKGNVSPGILVVIPQDAPLRSVVDTLVLIWADDRPEDWANAITIIPF
jgi:hypothetical protein